jgi:hypothetical protein
MTDEMIALRALLEKSSDAELLNETLSSMASADSFFSRA